jgi:hypothetical protein
MQSIIAKLASFYHPDGFRVLLVLVMLIAWVSSTKDGELSAIKTLFRKGMYWVDSILYMLLSKDTKGLGVKYQVPGSDADPEHLRAGGFHEASRKRVVFIRHGESDWNSIFNKGKNPMMLVRLLLAWVQEWLMVFSLESPFLDSPLNDEGIAQAVELRAFLEGDHAADSPKQKELLATIRGEVGNSVLVSSPLRRAISTLTLAVWPRMQRRAEKIELLSYAQEISRNVDTCALSGVKGVPELPFSRIAPHCAGVGAANYNAALNLGNKSLKNTGKMRIEAFNKWLFESPHDTVIVGGHSLWFKHFFNLCLPFAADHRAKTDKMTNSGVIVFDIYKANNGKAVCIDPASIDVVYGGFTKK